MPLVGQTYTTRQLPALTRAYLFDLIINGQAASAPKEVLQENPDGQPGTTHKFGSDRSRPPGADTFNRNRRQFSNPPGQYRIVRHMRGAQDIKWFYAEHVGGNSYRYYHISLPECDPCDGLAEVECDRCHGSQVRNAAHRINPANGAEQLRDMRKCPRCNGTGIIHCLSCWPAEVNTPKMYQGTGGPYTISLDRNRWDNF
jgi:hypothetical protein